jgi:hypothetical protein
MFPVSQATEPRDYVYALLAFLTVGYWDVISQWITPKLSGEYSKMLQSIVLLRIDI